MGLDAYFYKTTEDNVIRDGDNIISTIDDDKKTQLGYFRKNWDVQNLLTEYWMNLNPDADERDFNCAYLEITSGILEDLIESARHWIDTYDPKNQEWQFENAKELLVYCQLMHIALKEGQVVFYTNWY